MRIGSAKQRWKSDDAGAGEAEFSEFVLTDFRVHQLLFGRIEIEAVVPDTSSMLSGTSFRRMVTGTRWANRTQSNVGSI